jgi:hypothetical protein
MDLAVHVNCFPERSPPKGLSLSSLTAKEKEGLKSGEDFVKMGATYSLEHATRPSTIGLVLGSSPVALLAWIGEKILGVVGGGSGIGQDIRERDFILAHRHISYVNLSLPCGMYSSYLTLSADLSFHLLMPTSLMEY